MIVIPMAGLSSRFTSAGYNVPKYMLPLRDHTVFDFSVHSFKSVFETEEFLFLSLQREGLDDFITARATALGIKNFRLVQLDQPTKGQAETVEKGVSAAMVAENTPISIFNIDTFRLGTFTPYEKAYPKASGVLEVFRGSGDNWSFVEPDPERANKALRTAEKRPISNLCCTGLYYFSRVDLFYGALKAERLAPQSSELYVAPIYNHLIQSGGEVGYDVIDQSEVVFCGVPKEYEALQTLDADLPDLR